MDVEQQQFVAQGAVGGIEPPGTQSDRWEFQGVVNRMALAWRQSLGPLLGWILSALYWMGKLLFWAIGWVYTHWIATLVILCLLSLGFVFQMLKWVGRYYAWYLGIDLEWWDYTIFGGPSVPRVEVKFPEFKWEQPPPQECRVTQPETDPTILYCLIGAGVLNVLLLLAVIALIMKPNRVERVCDHGFRVEKAMEGSVPVKAESPDFVAEVWTLVGREVQRTQTAFRVGNRILTAHHGLKGKARAWLKFRGEMEEIDLSTVKEMDLDLVCFSYTPFSRWQMGSGKLATMSMPQYCKVHNGDFEVYGRTHPAFVVGMLDFDGTTLPSYSGAPYFVGRKIFGMHVGGSTFKNTGYDAAYINMLFESYVGESNDSFTTDPEELYKEMTKKGEELRYRNMGNDYYTVEVGGKFRMYDEQTFERIKERYTMRNTGQAKYEPESIDWDKLKGLQSVAQERLKPTAAFAYQDSENCQEPAVSVMTAAGPSCAAPKAPVSREPVVIPIPSCHTPPPTGLKSVPMPGQKLRHAQQNALSRTTFEDLQTLINLIQRNRLTVLELRGLQNLAMESE